MHTLTDDEKVHLISNWSAQVQSHLKQKFVEKISASANLSRDKASQIKKVLGLYSETWYAWLSSIDFDSDTLQKIENIDLIRHEQDIDSINLEIEKTFEKFDPIQMKILADSTESDPQMQ